MKIKILLTDDHTLFRQGIKTLLASENDFEVAGEAASGGEAVDKADEVRPDVVLMDVGMAGLSAFQAARQIRRARPETKILFLSMYDDGEYLAESMDAGGSGYILKDSPATQLVSAIRDVHRGGSYLSPRMLNQLVNNYRSRSASGEVTTQAPNLTAREQEVLKLLAEGNSVKEIACNLDLSVKTIEAHKFNLMRKLRIHNKAQLVQYAIRKKIIQLAEAV